MFGNKKNEELIQKENILIGVLKSNPMVLVIGLKSEEKLKRTARVSISIDEKTGKMRLEFIPFGWPLIVKEYRVELDMSDIAPIEISKVDPSASKEIETVIVNNYYKELTGIQL